MKISEEHFDHAMGIIRAYVGANPVSQSDLPALIGAVVVAVAKTTEEEPEPEVKASAPLIPAVPIKKSITPDFIICLDDGKKFRSLKRHLSELGMTPTEYRAKWKLPADYPMTSPSYSAQRSALAKSIGLGRKH